MAPKDGEIWRNQDGAARFVRSVDEDYSVTYSRAANGHRDWLTVLMRDWHHWVETTSAVRMRKANGPIDKDWRYATD